MWIYNRTTIGSQDVLASVPHQEIGLDEAAEARNDTMSGGETNQTTNGIHPLTFLFVQSAQSGSIKPVPANDTF